MLACRRSCSSTVSAGGSSGGLPRAIGSDEANVRELFPPLRACTHNQMLARADEVIE